MTRRYFQGRSPGEKGGGYKNEPVTTRQRAPHILSLASAAVIAIVTCLNAVSEEPTLCSDILYLIEQSKSHFLAIRGDTPSDFGDYNATFVLSGAWHCVIREDVEKSSYRCTWKYPHGDEHAHPHRDDAEQGE